MVRKFLIFETGRLLQTVSLRKPWRKAFLTSSCRRLHPLTVATVRTVRIVVGLITGLKVSTKSTPSLWSYLFATSQAFNRSKDPSALTFVLKTHLHPITFIWGCLGTRIHVWLSWRALISSSMAAYQPGCFKALLVVFGSQGSVDSIDVNGFE